MVADRRKLRGRIGRAHDHLERGGVAYRRNRAATGIGYGDQSIMRARLRQCGRPLDQRPAINAGRHDRCARQSGNSIGQRILVHVGDIDDDLHRLANHRHNVADIADFRCLVGAGDLDREGIAARQRFTRSVPVVGRREDDDMIPPCIGTRRNADLAGAVAIVDEGDEIGQRTEGAFVPQGQDQRIAIRIRGADGNFQDGVLGDRRIFDRAYHRTAVLVEHADGDDDVRGQRNARAIAVIGRTETYHMIASLRIGRRPGEIIGVRIKSRAGRQIADQLDGDCPGRFAGLDRLARFAVAKGGGIIGVVGIKGEYVEGKLLPFQHLPSVKLVEHGCGIGIFDGDFRDEPNQRFAVRDEEGNVIDAVLDIVGRPGKFAGRRVQRRAKGQRFRAIG